MQGLRTGRGRVGGGACASLPPLTHSPLLSIAAAADF